MNTRTPLFNFTPDERREYESATLRFTVAAQTQNYLDRAGLQAKDLAQRIHKSKAWVSKLLSGRQNATLNTLAEIALALGARWQIDLEQAEKVGTLAEQDPPPSQSATSHTIMLLDTCLLSSTRPGRGISFNPLSHAFKDRAEIGQIYFMRSWLSSSSAISDAIIGPDRLIHRALNEPQHDADSTTGSATGYLQFTER